MKKLYILLFVLVTMNGAIAQGCLPEGITFTTQEQIDNFQTNYPGCAEIEGDVTINGSDISNLNGLSILTSIGGNLIIGEPYYGNANPALANLTGLENLTSVQGNLTLENNSIMTNLTGLDNLSAVGGSLSISNNPLLSNISSLGSLTSIGSDLILGIQSWVGYPWGNPLLTSLTGLEGITSLTNLTIIGNHSLTDLTGLNNIQSISGQLLIAGNDSLSSLTGLEELTYIGENLQFGSGAQLGWVGNPVLTNLTGLEGLTVIGGDLKFAGSSLLDLEGLNNLAIIGNDLILFDNAFITLAGLDNLDTIFGNFQIGPYPGTGGADWSPGGNSIPNFTGIENLTAIGGDLAICWNDSLNNLAGLSNVTSIGGDLIIYNNDNLTSIAGLENIDAESIQRLQIFYNNLLSDCEIQNICDYLASPNGSVDINNNAAGCNSPPEVASNCGLTAFCLPFGNYYFQNQTDIDNFEIDYPGCETLGGKTEISGHDINNLSGISVVTFVGGDIEIGNYYENGTSLNNLEGLNNVDSITGRLKIFKNTVLNSLTGLDNLTSIGGQLYISSNNLSNLSGLENLTSIGGSLEIHNNPLFNLTGLNNLSSVGGSCIISGNMTSLTGLEGLTFIGGGLYLVNTQLTNTSGLSNLTSIGEGHLIVYSNPYLTSLSGFFNINANSIADLKIFNNNSLSNCSVQSICDYLANPNGIIEIHDNDPGCDSQEQVEAACDAVYVESFYLEDNFVLFPNPAFHFVTITTKAGTTISEVIIYNQTGQKVYRGIPENNTLDISKLQPGMYVVEVVTNEGNARKKVIVQ